MPSWVEITVAVGSAIGAVGGVVGAVGGFRGNQARKNAATAIQDSADAGRDAADALRLAAKANEKATRLAESSLRLEHERRHDDLRPAAPTPFEVELEPHPRLEGHKSLFGSIMVPRDYRVRANAISGRTTWPLTLDLVLRGGRVYRFEIEQWPPDRRKPVAKELRFRFWPPAKVDDAEQWDCPCDRPASGDRDSDAGHWEWRVPVDFHDYDVRKSVW